MFNVNIKVVIKRCVAKTHIDTVKDMNFSSRGFYYELSQDKNLFGRKQSTQSFSFPNFLSLLQVKIKWLNLLDLIFNLNLNVNIWTTNSADVSDVHKSLLHVFQVQMWHIWWGDFSQKSKCQHTKDTTGESRSISRVKIRIKKQCTKNNIKTVYKSKQTGDGELRQVLIKMKLEHDAQWTVRSLQAMTALWR